jgi:hypothetical protein
MISKLCEPEHLIIIILVLFAALVLMGTGRGLGKLLGPLVNKLLGRENINLTVNTGENGMAETRGAGLMKGGICDPEKCAPLVAIKGQQQRNIGDIEKLGNDIHDWTILFFKKLNFIQQQNAVILRAMVKNNQLKESDIPKEIP